MPQTRYQVESRMRWTCLNFFLADVRDGLGPYLSIYLLLTHHWDQASIGFVMGIGGIAAIAAQTPVGALVDRTSAKRGADRCGRRVDRHRRHAGHAAVSALHCHLAGAGR